MLTQAIKPSSRDWVGIFKVGWSSTRQYLAFDWAPIPTNWEAGKICTQRIMLDGKSNDIVCDKKEKSNLGVNKLFKVFCGNYLLYTTCRSIQ